MNKIKYSCIYKIINPSGNIYIGQTSDIETRLKTYKYKRCLSQPAIYNSIIKYGWENHTFIILKEGFYSIELLNRLEIYYIKFYNSFNDGLNCTEGGEGIRGYKHSNSTILKLRELAINRSEEVRNNMRISRLNWLKTNPSPSTGRKYSKETIDKMKKNSLGLFGKDNPKSKKVIDTSNGIIYDSLVDLCNTLNLNIHTVGRYLRKTLPNKTTFLYLEEYDRINQS